TIKKKPLEISIKRIHNQRKKPLEISIKTTLTLKKGNQRNAINKIQTHKDKNL
uniref:Uncharacterized protein n=1 Tax=Amphimedon queenslandica TaxID=400682 RepID=A0A1X7VUW2_AMPQE